MPRSKLSYSFSFHYYLCYNFLTSIRKDEFQVWLPWEVKLIVDKFHCALMVGYWFVFIFIYGTITVIHFLHGTITTFAIFIVYFFRTFKLYFLFNYMFKLASLQIWIDFNELSNLFTIWEVLWLISVRIVLHILPCSLSISSELLSYISSLTTSPRPFACILANLDRI